jgi:tape measure domain-containing protein
MNSVDAAAQAMVAALASMTSAVGEASRAVEDMNASNASGVGEAGKLGEALSSLIGTLAALGAAAISVDAIKDSLQQVTEVGSKFEDLTIRLNATMGGIKEGEAAVKWITQFAKDTPMEIDGVTQAFIQLKNFGIDPMDGSLQAMSDIVSKAGGGAEKMEQIITALGQSWTKTKLQGEETMQLMEAGVPVWDLLGKALNKTTVELQQMAEKGQLGRTEIKLLIDEIGNSSKGAASATMNSWTGMVSNLSDTWTGFVNEVSKQGQLDGAKNAIGDVSQAIKDIDGKGELTVIAAKVSEFYQTIQVGIAEVATFVIKNSDAIGDGFSTSAELIGQFGNALKALGTPLAEFFRDNQQNWEQAKTFVKDFVEAVIESFKNTADSKEFANALKAIGDVISSLIETAKSLAEGLSTTFNGGVAGADKAAQATSALSFVMEALAGTVGLLTEAFLATEKSVKFEIPNGAKVQGDFSSKDASGLLKVLKDSGAAVR